MNPVPRTCVLSISHFLIPSLQCLLCLTLYWIQFQFVIFFFKKKSLAKIFLVFHHSYRLMLNSVFFVHIYFAWMWQLSLDFPCHGTVEAEESKGKKSSGWKNWRWVLLDLYPEFQTLSFPRASSIDTFLLPCLVSWTIWNIYRKSYILVSWKEGCLNACQK